MNKYFFSLLILFLAVSSYAQPDIYSETDIELQSLFFDAQIEKIKGNTEKEIEILQEVLKRDRQSDAAYYELARAYVAENNYEMAQKNAIKATTIDPQNNWYLLTLAEIYEASNQRTKAISTYESLIALEDDNPALYHKLSVNQLHANMPDEAAGTLETLQSKTSVTEETSRRLFDIYSKSGKKEKALQTLQTLSNKYPDDEQFLGNLASYYHDLGRQEEAIKVFEKMLEINPNNAQAAIAMMKVTSRNMDSGSKSIADLSGLIPIIDNMDIPLDTKIQELMPHLANMEKDGPSTPTLISISDKLIKQYPNDAKVYSVRGDVLFYSGDYDAAEKSYAQAIKLDNRKYTLWDQYMINLWQNSNYKKLETVSYDALDLFPNQVNAFVTHAIALKQNMKADEATDYLDEAKFIAGKNELLIEAVQIAQYWSSINNNAKEQVSTFINKINTAQISNPLYMELIGDLYQSIDDNNNSKKFWQLAIELGAKESRLQKKIGV
jgi:tetratricopeptide (TPR) repeat protein